MLLNDVAKGLCLVLALLPAVYYSVGCGTDTEPTWPPELRSQTSALSALPTIEVLDAGGRKTTVGCTGSCAYVYRIWVDMAIRNDAYDKVVAYRFTSDNWHTSEVAYAAFVRKLPDGRELWRKEVTGAVVTDASAEPPDIQFKASATISEHATDDPYNNYHISGFVALSQPVKLVSATASRPAGSGVVTGTIRVLNLAFAKQVTVHYSTDGWRTSHDVDARYLREQLWDFELSPLSGAVEFAVRYRVAGREYWDNNHGANYRISL